MASYDSSDSINQSEIAMLTFLLCLLPILASIFGPTSAHYILDIHNNTMKNARAIIHPVLNLSGMNLQSLEENVFDHVRDLESLDLSNNSLISLPEFIFSNLNKLKNISLANNQLWNLHNLFFGLNNLQLLDISRNPITHLRKGSLFGLPKFVRILTDENNFWSISTDIWNNLLSQNDEMAGRRAKSNTENENEREVEIIHDTKFQNVKKYRAIHMDNRLIFCKSDGIVTTLDILLKETQLAEGCVKVSIDILRNSIGLHDENITGFRKDWNRLYFLPFVLDLSNNKIAEIEEETLNNLPTGLACVNFQNNQIRKIRSQVIENNYLRELNFRNNLLEMIEDNAFAKTRLHNLILNENQLRSLNFVSTLPDTMIKFSASRNRITSIPNNTFSRLSHLSYLNLQENKIETLQNGVFQNLSSLRTLILARNDITTIELACFKDLTMLKTLDFQRNFIRDLQASTLAELTELRMLNLNSNKIDNVTFINLPRTLKALYLDFNEIRALEKGSFVLAPRIALSLVGNNISSIARGAFNLPRLKVLYLSENNLTTIEGDSYEGLNRLRHLWLTQNQISEIRKGSCKNLRSLHLLALSSNPFQKLEAGAFYGLSTDAGGDLHIYNNNLKEMQAGLFDDI